MDLLLFFIRRDEVDIHDIPIAHITDEYLAYVRLLEEIDLDGVADFIYMAAVLINLKARTLLPVAQADEEGEDVDPRRELAERLMEYVRYKEAATQLRQQEHRRAAQYTRGEAASERDAMENEQPVDIHASVYDLMTAMGALLQVDDEDGDADPTHEVEPLPHTVEEQRRYVLERVLHDEQIAFRSLVRRQSKAFVIATFLAVLELARQQHLHLTMSTGDADFVIQRS